MEREMTIVQRAVTFGRMIKFSHSIFALPFALVSGLIAWKSEPDSQIQTEGRVELFEVAPNRGTAVRLIMKYDPPAGLPGRAIAKILQREPNVQARRDLRRFKMLIETGEVSVNASPSARKSETPTQPTI